MFLFILANHFITMAASKPSHFFSLLKSALSGSEKEFTSGSIDRAIFLLAVPMVLEMVMESLFAVVDAYFVGGLGKEALAAVGLTESVLTIVYSIAIGLSMAATALVSRRIGEKDSDGAAHSGVQAIYASVAVALVLGALGVIFSKQLLLLMGASPAFTESHYVYSQIVLGSNIVVVLLFLINGIFRGAGDASVAMKSLWLANGINILLCPTLIKGLGPFPALGLEGAAWATVIGRGSGVLYQLWHLVKGKGLFRIARRHLGFDVPVMGNLLKLASGGTAQFLINSASWIFLVRIVSSFGEDAVAGYTIGIRVIVFTILPAWGLSNAAATLVGQNLGAQLPERAERSVWRAAFLNMVFLGFISVLFFAAARPIVSIFSQEPAVVEYGVQCLRYISVGYVFYGYGMVIASSFNGAGDTRTPTILNLLGFWAFQIPLAYVLAILLGFGPQGAFWAVSISESCLALAAIMIFRKGKWKTVKV
jgi:putative MATE family efflux protein